MEELSEAVRQLKEMYAKVGIEIAVSEEEYYWGDPKEAPRKELWEVYYDGYWGMKQSFLSSLVREIETRYGKKFDHIVIAMDARNWYGDVPDNKVWGWNISAGILGYDVQQCRVDTVSRRKETRIANTLGTIYHELMHSHVHYPYRVFTGAKIERNLKSRGYTTTDWTEQVVHGTGPEWEYIRHKENQDALKAIAPVLKACYEVRKRQHEKGMTALESLREGLRTQVIKATEPFAMQ
jgi:hypothetical protein